MQRRNILILTIFFALTAVAQQNNDAKKLYNEGNAKLKAGDFAGAITKYEEALKLEKHEFFYYQLGLAHRKSRSEDQAIKAFQNAVSVNPKFAAGYNALGGGYFAMKQYDKSLEHYEKALAENPTLGPAKKGLAASQAALAAELVNKGETTKVIDLTKKAIENDPSLAQAYVIMAQAYNKDGKLSEAIQAAESAIKTMKTARKGAAYFELGIAHRNSGNMTKAKEAFLEAKKDPTYARNADYELKQLPK